EITKRVIQYGFRELNLNKIIAITYEENQNSKKSLDLLGFKCTFIGAIILIVFILVSIIMITTLKTLNKIQNENFMEEIKTL
ncbi:GNAT family N-acetyltransferase, partial [Clostridioides difficile]|uniref:GNAT family N-acetyltransferase n=1 Tax=Clostridioides difficile TaxID=1496 RepID=UPI003F8D17AB